MKSSGSVTPATTATNSNGNNKLLVATFFSGFAVLINAIVIPMHPKILENPYIIYFTEGSSAVKLPRFPISAIRIG